MALLNVKSQEISRLDSLLVAERAEKAALVKEAEALRDALAAASSGPRPREIELEHSYMIPSH